jgi:hypothetical protein
MLIDCAVSLGCHIRRGTTIRRRASHKAGTSTLHCQHALFILCQVSGGIGPTTRTIRSTTIISQHLYGQVPDGCASKDNISIEVRMLYV